jgi:glycosyltransferase involved in cell wall biosynthesis
MGKMCSRIEVLNLTQNGGKAEAIRQGMLAIKDKNVDCVGYWDADLATPLEEITRFLNELQNRPNYKLLIGSRWKHLGAQIERKTQRHFIGRIFATLASLILGLSVYDTQCGAKILRKELISDLFAKPFITYWIFDVELFFRLRNSMHFKNNADCILEIPLQKWQDKAGSKLKIWDFLKAPLELWKIFIYYKK